MRALLLVLDSVGVGNAADAAQFGDEGAATVPHILEKIPTVHLPTLMDLGLGHILGDPKGKPHAAWGRMAEVSQGKDSTTGHWELAGVIPREKFALFERFPPALLDPIEQEAGIKFLGN